MFMEEFGPLIRRHYRRKLGRVMRRVVDSQDLLSTITRRLDRRVLSGGLRLTEPNQLWALIYRIGDTALVDRVHLTERLARLESADTEVGTLLRRKVLDSGQDEQSFASGIDSILSSLETDDDRTLLVLWMHEKNFVQIGEQLGISPATARKRWERMRGVLRDRLEAR